MKSINLMTYSKRLNGNQLHSSSRKSIIINIINTLINPWLSVSWYLYALIISSIREIFLQLEGVRYLIAILLIIIVLEKRDFFNWIRKKFSEDMNLILWKKSNYILLRIRRIWQINSFSVTTHCALIVG